MRKMIWVPIATALIGCAAVAAQGQDGTKGYTPKEQERLDQLLKDRVAGEPQSCVNLRDIPGNEGFGSDLIVFKGQTNSSPIYLNKPPGGCASFRSSSALKARVPSTRLCRGDIVEVFDPVAGFSYGACGLGDFVPYRKGG